jgi:hypothetical protein
MKSLVTHFNRISELYEEIESLQSEIYDIVQTALEANKKVVIIDNLQQRHRVDGLVVYNQTFSFSDQGRADSLELSEIIDIMIDMKGGE